MPILPAESKTFGDDVSKICLESERRKSSSQSRQAYDPNHHCGICLGVLRVFAAIALLALTAVATAQEIVPRRAEPIRRAERPPEEWQINKVNPERARECFFGGNCNPHRPPKFGQLSPENSIVRLRETPRRRTLHQTLRFRMDVREAQRRLDALGYTVSVDGQMGPKTHSALSNFQRDRGLPVTGLLDDATAERLRVNDDFRLSAIPRLRFPTTDKDLLGGLKTPRQQATPLVPADELIFNRHPALGESSNQPNRKALLNANGASQLRMRSPESLYSILNVQRRNESIAISLTSNGSTRQWVVAEGDSTGSAEIAERLSSSKVIVHDGDPLPEPLLSALVKDHHYVRRSKLSPNTGAELAAAAELGEKSLNLNTTNFYNSLPQETGFASYMELIRMGLKTSQRKEWQELNDNVVRTASSLGLPLRVTQKAELIADLAGGTNDIVVLIAHSDGESIYFSGTRGDSLSLDEISKISRREAPNRIFVAIVCEGGGVNNDQESLAELLLKNRLAKTVFASPKPVDARDVPELLRKLAQPGTRLGDVLSPLGLEQYVVIVPPNFWRKPPGDQRPL